MVSERTEQQNEFRNLESVFGASLMISKRVLLHTSMLFSKHEWSQIDPPVSPRRCLHHLLDGQVFCGLRTHPREGVLKCYVRTLVILPISFTFFPFALYYNPLLYTLLYLRLSTQSLLANVLFNGCARVLLGFALSNTRIDLFHLL